MRPDDRPGVEDAVAPHFHVVTQHGAALLPPRGDGCKVALKAYGGLDGDGGLIALDVGGDGPRTQVSLVAQDGIPHVVVVGHLHSVEEDAVLQLGGIAYHTVVPHQRAAANIGAMPHLGVLPDDGGGRNMGTCPFVGNTTYSLPKYFAIVSLLPGPSINTNFITTPYNQFLLYKILPIRTTYFCKIAQKKYFFLIKKEKQFIKMFSFFPRLPARFAHL